MTRPFRFGLGKLEIPGDAAQWEKISRDVESQGYDVLLVPDHLGRTAPFPPLASHSDQYGGGYITGNIGGISKGSKNPELAWALLKYLTLNTGAVVKMANGLKNVPHLTSALQSSDLEVDSQYKTFIIGASDPSSLTTPASPVGAGYQTTFEQWWEKYQETGTGSIAAGLKTVDQQINASEALAAP